MAPKSYRTPPHLVSNRARCPVCHEAAYSRGGMWVIRLACGHNLGPDPSQPGPGYKLPSRPADADAPSAGSAGPPDARPTASNHPMISATAVGC